MTDIAEPLPTVAIPASQSGDLSVRIRRGAEYVVIPLLALGITAFLFSLFLLALGKSPIQFFELVERGGFGTAFSLQNTLQRSSPLILTALCVALPARIGLVVIGGEGALVLGGFASAVVAIPLVLGKVSPLLRFCSWPRPACWSARSGSALSAICAMRAASTKPSRRY